MPACLSLCAYAIYARPNSSTNFDEIVHTYYKFIKLREEQHFNLRRPPPGLAEKSPFAKTEAELHANNFSYCMS